MISNQIIQTSIDELKAITKVDLCVYDLNGTWVAGSVEAVDLTQGLIRDFAYSPADSQVIGTHHLLKIYDEGDLLYVLVAKGYSDDVYMVGKIAVCQIQNLVIAYKEKIDRNGFFQNLILDNMLLVDIYNRAKKLRIEVSAARVIYLIEAGGEKDGMVMELLRGMFSPQTGDYVTAVDENSVILIKSVDAEATGQASISKCPKVLSRIERMTGSITYASCHSTVNRVTSMTLGAILYELQVILLAKLPYFVGIGNSTI